MSDRPTETAANDRDVTHAVSEVIAWLDGMAAGMQTAHDKTVHPGARHLLGLKAATYRFIAERLRDPRPLDEGSG